MDSESLEISTEVQILYQENFTYILTLRKLFAKDKVVLAQRHPKCLTRNRRQ